MVALDRWWILQTRRLEKSLAKFGISGRGLTYIKWLVLVPIVFLLAYLLASALSPQSRYPAVSRTRLEEDNPLMRIAFPFWIELHDKYVREIEEAQAAGGYDLIWYGDSITEGFRETQIGLACPAQRCLGMKQVWDHHYGGKLKAVNFAISGDTTSHLMWRLENGEGPAGLHAKIIIVLIGTNDLTRRYPDEEGRPLPEAGQHTAEGVIEISEFLLRTAGPDAKIILVGTLPRGERFTDEQGTVIFDQPSKFTAAVEDINEQLKQYARKAARVEFVDCGPRFLAPGGDRLDPELMPDALHPSAKGLDLLAECLQPDLAFALVNPRAGYRPAGTR